MEFEFDPAKDARNVRERGLSLSVGVAVLAGVVGWFEDVRKDYGERRFVAFGVVGERLLCLVYTRRGERMRFISLRQANAKEVKRWLGNTR